MVVKNHKHDKLSEDIADVQSEVVRTALPTLARVPSTQ